jgi:CRP-like cAMP-binding protein
MSRFGVSQAEPGPQQLGLLQKRILAKDEEVSIVQRQLARNNTHPGDRLRRNSLSPGANQESLQNFRVGEFMKSLSAAMIQELESIAAFADCPPGMVLFAEGEPPEEAFLLLQGDVKLFIDASNGKRLAVHIAMAGEILGLASAFTGDPHRTTAVALHSAKVASIRRPDFLNFVLNYPKACQAAAREMGKSFDQACTRLRTIGATSANRAKVARLLLEWSAKGKATPRGIQIHVALKHGEIAECIGTVRESVTRILRDFKRWQIIEHRGSLLTILNPSALEKWANIK